MLEAWKSECLYSFFLSFLFVWGGGEGSVEFITMNLILGGYIPWVYQNFIELFGWKEIEIGDGLPNIRLTGKCLEALKQAGFEVSDISYFILFFVFSLLNLCYDLHKWQRIYLFCQRTCERKILQWTHLSPGTCLKIKVTCHRVVSF